MILYTIGTLLDLWLICNFSAHPKDLITFKTEVTLIVYPVYSMCLIEFHPLIRIRVWTVRKYGDGLKLFQFAYVYRIYTL